MDHSSKNTNSAESFANLTVIATQGVQQEQIQTLSNKYSLMNEQNSQQYAQLLIDGILVTQQVENARDLLFDIIDAIKSNDSSDETISKLKEKASNLLHNNNIEDISDIRSFAYNLLNNIAGDKVIEILTAAIKLRSALIIEADNFYQLQKQRIPIVPHLKKV